MRYSQAGKVALGGVMAALAVVIMMLGGLIPVATYVCPTLCTLICAVVYHSCGTRITWAWYAAVALLSLLFAPDKEAAAVLVIIGFYPIVKSFFDSFRLGILLKILYFNSSVLLLYYTLIRLLGMDQIAQEYKELGALGLIIFLVLCNIVFILLDYILLRFSKRLMQ